MMNSPISRQYRSITLTGMLVISAILTACALFPETLVSKEGALAFVLTLLCGAMIWIIQLRRLLARASEVEEVLRAGDDQYRLLFKEMSSGFVLYEVVFDEQGRPIDGRHLEVNPAFEHLTGLSAQSILGKTLTEARIDSYREHMVKIARVMATGESARFEAKGTITDRYYDVTAYRVRKDRLAVVLSDITMRIMAERDRRLTQFAVDKSADAAFWVLPDGRFAYANETACRFLGYQRSELLKLKVFDIDPRFSEESWPDHWATVREQGSLVIEPLHGNNGYYQPAEITVNYVEFEQEEYHCAFARDVTERLKGQELREKLQRAEKMESLGILAGGVAHDLNNMLGPLVGYPDLILKILPEDNPVRKHVQRISTAAQSASDVIQDLLTLARRGRYEMTPTCLSKVVEEYIDSANYARLRETHPNVNVTTLLDNEVANMSGSSAHLSKLIMNLVVNAFDAMPDSGELTIEVTQQYLEHLPVSGHAKIDNGDYVVLRVGDNGSGIASEELTKIFEPYYSSKKMGSSGSGLGLAVVYGIVKDHDGFYDISSEPGRGTDFMLFFPVVHDVISQPTLSALNPGGHERILVVDDLDEQRELAEELLSSLGYAVETASSGEEAVEYLSRKSVDIILLDMIMEGGMDGLDTYREIIKLYPALPTIIASGFSPTARVEQMQQLGAGQYIRKPYTLKTLALATRQELDKTASQASAV